jgi:hypothetical protein
LLTVAGRLFAVAELRLLFKGRPVRGIPSGSTFAFSKTATSFLTFPREIIAVLLFLVNGDRLEMVEYILSALARVGKPPVAPGEILSLALRLSNGIRNLL